MWGIFGNKSKSNLPEPTALETQRAKQIELLKAFNQNVSELQRDVEYRVNTVVNGISIAINVVLPPRFPMDKPTVKVSPTLQHPWIGTQNMVVGCPGLNNFVMHSDLGKVINDIIEEFNRNPPKVIETPPAPHGVNRYAPYPAGAAFPTPVSTSFPAPTSTAFQAPTSTAYPTSSSSAFPNSSNFFAPSAYVTSPLPPTISTAPSASMYSASTGPQLPPGPFGSYRLPDVPDTLLNLNGKSDDELKELLDNEDQLIMFLSDLPQVQQISKDRATLADDNERAAKSNLAQKPALEEKKRILLEKYDQLNDLRKKFDESAERQDVLRNHYSTAALEANLKVAAQQAEEQAEHVAEHFIEGKVSIDEFKKQFMETRKLSHLRKIKEEKLSHGTMLQSTFQ